MISNNSSLEVHNKFELQLCDIDGNIEQEAYAYNAANSLRYMLHSMDISINSVGGSSQNDTGFAFLALGDGDISINSPKSTDRFLANRRFNSDITRNEFRRITPFTKEYQTIEYQSAEHTFPATRDYIANLTEIGLISHWDDHCYSHAALVDAEGNSIIIKKTEYNILKVKCTIYITPVLTVTNAALNFKFFPAYSSVLGGCCIYGETEISTFDSDQIHLPSVKGGTKFYFSPQYVPESSDGIIYDNPMMTRERGMNNSLMSASWRYNQSMIFDSTTLDFSPVFPITNYIDNELITQQYKNFGFAHSIVFPNFGAIALPNENIIPKYTIDVAIGTGDGEKTIFYTSVNELAIDANSQPILKVYFQNSEEESKKLVDPSLYTFTNCTAKKSPLWNKMIYVEEKKTGEKISAGSYIMNFAADDVYLKTKYDSCWIGYCVLTNSTFKVQSKTGTQGTGVEAFFAPGYSYDAVYYDENGITLDEGKIGTYGSWYRNSMSVWHNPSLTLFYKDSLEEEWDSNKSILIPASSTDSNIFNVTKFTPITAKYWKLQLTNFSSYTGMSDIVVQGSNRLNSCSFSQSTAKDNQIMGIDPNFIILGNSAEYDFSKVGLSFTTPPPAGTIITMEATLDLPYKTPDGSMTFSFQSTLNPPNTGA